MSPTADRPFMPGYGIEPADRGRTGLLGWDEAVRRLATSRNFWLATVWPDGRPHVMPVWGLWRDDALWFSSSLGSRKIRNLLHNPACTMSTEDADHPVVVDGLAAVVTDRAAIAAFLADSNAKYEVDYSLDFLDPAVNATVRVTPRWVFALDQEDFSGSPTRWRFER